MNDPKKSNPLSTSFLDGREKRAASFTSRSPESKAGTSEAADYKVLSEPKAAPTVSSGGGDHERRGSWFASVAGLFSSTREKSSTLRDSLLESEHKPGSNPNLGSGYKPPEFK